MLEQLDSMHEAQGSPQWMQNQAESVACNSGADYVW